MLCDAVAFEWEHLAPKPKGFSSTMDGRSASCAAGDDQDVCCNDYSGCTFLLIHTLRHAPSEAGISAADLDSAHTGSQSHSIGLDSVRFVAGGLPQTLHARVIFRYQCEDYTYTIAPRCTGNESAERPQTLHRTSLESQHAEAICCARDDGGRAAAGSRGKGTTTTTTTTTTMMKITKHAAAAAAGVLVLLAAQSLVASAGAEDPGTSDTHIHTCAGP